MVTRYNEAILLILDPDVEGGYSNHEWDNGGETKYGITKRWYPHLDIPNLTFDQAIEIHRVDRWDKINGDRLPWIFALPILDRAINQGVEPASRFFQLAVGNLRPDGIIGSVTARAAASVVDKEKVLADYLSRCAFSLAKMEDWNKAGRGWMRRLFTIQQKALDG